MFLCALTGIKQVYSAESSRLDLLFFELDCFDATGLLAPDAMTCASLVEENWSRGLSRKSFNGAFVGRLFVFWLAIGKAGNRGT